MRSNGVEFIGRWVRGERALAESAVRAAEHFIGRRMARPWVFQSQAGGEFSVTQPSLFEGKLTAPNVPDLLEKIHRAGADAARGGDGR